MKIKIMILLFAIAVVSTGSAYFIYRYSHGTEQPNQSQASRTWKTYTSNGGDFSVEYPSSWTSNFLRPSDGSLQKVGFFNSENKSLVVTIEMTKSDKTIEEALLPIRSKGAPNATLDEHRKLELTGRPAIYIAKTLRYPEKKASIIERSYAIKDGDTLFVVSFHEFSDLSSAGFEAYDNKALANDFEKLVKSFRIKN